MKRGLPAALAAALVIAGCGSSAGLDVGSTRSADSGTATSASVGGGQTHTSSSMAGMSMGASSTAQGATSVPTVNGVKPVPSQVLATATWQGMKIQARTMTPIPFYIYNGTKLQKIKPSKKTSFHLMVMLDDAHTNEPIPYATVWATIRKAGVSKPVYDHSQYAMISAYMGPHYGDNVTLPGPGKYKLTLLIGPPVSARHVEYKSVWLKPHRVTVGFTWRPPK